MQRKHMLLVITTIAITFLLIIFTPSDHPSLIWRKVLHKSPGIMGPYQAPLHGCDNANNDRVYQSYLVFLHRGCSLEHHKQVVGDGADLDSAIKIVFPETRHHGLYYSAELDDIALGAVRADVGVDMVEYNRRVHMDEEPFALGEKIE